MAVACQLRLDRCPSYPLVPRLEVITRSDVQTGSATGAPRDVSVLQGPKHRDGRFFLVGGKRAMTEPIVEIRDQYMCDSAGPRENGSRSPNFQRQSGSLRPHGRSRRRACSDQPDGNADLPQAQLERTVLMADCCL